MTRKTYTKEYKEEAADYVISSGKPIAQVARELGIGEQMLGRLVAAVLRIEQDSIKEFTVTNPELVPEQVEGKGCRLDVNMNVDGAIVDIEVQLGGRREWYKMRAGYYLSRLHAGSLPKSRDYNEVPKTVLVSILDFDLFDSEGYYSKFSMMETSRGELLSDRLNAVFLELGKLPALDRDDMLSLWLHLIRAESTEDLDEIRSLGVGIMDKAAQSVEDIQESRRLQHLALRRDIAEHDYAQGIHDAERRGIALGEQRGKHVVIQQMIYSGFDSTHIAKATGCSKQQIQDILKDANQ